LKKAISHKGYAIVDMFQPCPSYNKIQTFEWFKQNTYYLEETYNPNDRIEAFKRSLETEKLPLGIFYINQRKTFEENIGLYQNNKESLCFRERDQKTIAQYIDSALR